MPTEIRDLQALIDTVDSVANSFRTEVWWRGHAIAEWVLQPGVFRGTHPDGYERTVSTRFLLRARARHPSCPADGDWPGWLFLMQHYRLPTRLLDWTESALMAAYFAVREHRDKAGSLIAMSPIILNEALSAERGLLSTGHKLALPLFLPPFRSEAQDVDRVAALVGAETNIRMLVQHSVFTLHGSAKPIEACTPNARFLMRFTLPSDAKPKLLQQLDRLGIRESYLFPDLEHLANEISSWTFEPI